MTTVAPKPIVTRPWPVRQARRGSAFARIIRQRDAAEVRNVRLAMRNTVLMEQLDKQIEETGGAWELLMALDKRTKQLEAEALPKAPNWGAAPAPMPCFDFDGRPVIFDAVTTASAS